MSDNGSEDNPTVINGNDDDDNNNSTRNQGRFLAKYKVNDTVLYISGRVVNRNRDIKRIGTIIKSRWEMMNGIVICQYMMRNSQHSLSGSSEIWINETDIISRRYLYLVI